MSARVRETNGDKPKREPEGLPTVMSGYYEGIHFCSSLCDGEGQEASYDRRQSQISNAQRGKHDEGARHNQQRNARERATSKEPEQIHTDHIVWLRCGAPARRPIERQIRENVENKLNDELNQDDDEIFHDRPPRLCAYGRWPDDFNMYIVEVWIVETAFVRAPHTRWQALQSNLFSFYDEAAESLKLNEAIAQIDDVISILGGHGTDAQIRSAELAHSSGVKPLSIFIF